MYSEPPGTKKKVYLIKILLCDHSCLISHCFSPKSVVLQIVTSNLNSKSLLIPIKIRITVLPFAVLVTYLVTEKMVMKYRYETALAASPLSTEVQNFGGAVGPWTL